MGVPKLVDGRFELEAEVGSGGMGTVYRAIDLARGGERVALKVHTSSSWLSLQRFEREAEILAPLSHPHVVRYIAHGLMTGDRLYVVMEWVDGLTLADHLDQRGVTLAEAVALTATVADALAYIHDHGILHRDLKPTNVMLRDGRPTLIDFGLARNMRSGHKLTETGASMGTPGYMSPEQVLGGELDTRSDMFSLGCLLYECLTGVSAFFGPTWVAVQTRILLKPVIPPQAYGVDVPDRLLALLDSLLAKDAGSRPSSASAVADVLRGLGELDSKVRQTTTGPRDVTRRTPPGWKFPAQPEHLVIAVVGDSAIDEVDLAARLAALGGKLSRLHEGAIVVAIGPGAESPALRAARCALALRALSPAWPISIVDNSDAGLDAATRELGAAELAAVFRQDAPTIRIDEVSAAELDTMTTGDFVVRRDRQRCVLVPMASAASKS